VLGVAALASEEMSVEHDVVAFDEEVR